MLADRLVLIVTEAGPARDILRVALELSDFQCMEESDTQLAYAVVMAQKPDLILLDSSLAETSDYELVRRLRREPSMALLSIVILSDRYESGGSPPGMEVGADDYILKTMPPRELVSRLKAVLNRVDNYSSANPLFACGLCLNPRTHAVTINECLVPIGPTEYRLLEYFLSHQERVHSRESLLEKVWGGNAYVQLRTVDVHIRRLRKALTVDGHDRFVQTVRGAGYRFSHKHVLRR